MPTWRPRTTPPATAPWKPSYCRKEVEGCYCAVGWPYELQCPKCRDSEHADPYSYCACPPPHHPDNPLPHKHKWRVIYPEEWRSNKDTED